jgi:hypothetical protein
VALRSSLEAGVRPAFPPSLVVQVKALACELPCTLGLPLSRLSVEEIRQHVISQGLVAEMAEISGATLWRWLSSDALRPWKPGNIEAGSFLRSELCRMSAVNPPQLKRDKAIIFLSEDHGPKFGVVNAAFVHGLADDYALKG